MPKIDNINRSRLKVTIVASVALIILAFFPMWFIYFAAVRGEFHAVAAWSSWAATITAMATLAGFYIKKDSDRPSFVNNTVSNIHVPELMERKVLDGEDESDPAETPL